MWLASHWIIYQLCLWPSFTVDHAINFPTGGFPTLQHNKSRDFTAAILAEVCSDVRAEPPLQPLKGEGIFLMSKCLMLMHLHNIVVPKYLHFINVLNVRNNGQRIREIEMGSFTPLVFSTFGGMGNATAVFYRRLAFLVSLRK